jgi:hypothetical protein
MDFKRAYDSVSREVLYNVLTEFGTPMQLVWLLNTCVNEIYSRVRVGKHLSEMLPIKNGLKKVRCFIAIAFHLWFIVCH